MKFTRVGVGRIVGPSGGLGGFTLRTDTATLTHLMRWMKYESVYTQRDPNIVIPFVRKFGAATWQLFRREVWPGGRQDWARLAPYTMDKREERGYGAEGPVLRQSGQLADMASTPFRNWSWGQKSIRGKQATAPYGDKTSLTATASINNGVFDASISGERVKNQQAYYISRRDGSKVGVPPRPFWGLTPEILDDAMPSAMEQFAQSWAKRKPTGLR
jgi:phage gpG-like protein